MLTIFDQFFCKSKNINNDTMPLKVDKNECVGKDVSSYTIRVIEDIHDPDLVHHWKRIEEEADVFPQMYYEWCEPWWRLCSGKRKLHIVAVEDASGKIVGIAPLCIERRFGLRVLRSFPMHFCDFYTFISAQSEALGVGEAIAAYATRFCSWSLVHIHNVNDASQIFEVLKAADFKTIHTTDVLAVTFADQTFDEYLQTRSKNTRQQFGKKLRRLQKIGEVTLGAVDDAHGYRMHAEILGRIYNARWINDHRLPPTDDQLACRNEAVAACLDRGKMILFLLRLNGEVIAFRLGFLHANGFFDYRVSHDPQYDSYSPGTLVLGKIVEYLMHRNVTYFNFMTGDYSYKASWATEGAASANYDFFAACPSTCANLYVKYRLQWRHSLRTRYHRLLKVPWFRKTKRWAEAAVRRFQT